MQADFDLINALGRLLMRVSQLQEAIDDTKMAVGSQVFGKSLQFYQAVKLAKDANVTGLTEIFEDLRTRWIAISNGTGTNENTSQDDNVNDSDVALGAEVTGLSQFKKAALRYESHITNHSGRDAMLRVSTPQRKHHPQNHPSKETYRSPITLK